MQFTSRQLAEYNKNGYVIIDCPFSETLTNACLEAVEKVAAEPLPEEDNKKNHPELLSHLTPEQHEVLYLNRDFEIDPKYHSERDRELGKVKWSVI